MEWRILNAVDQIDTVISASHTSPVAIFKHSTRCSISSMAQSRLERDWEKRFGDIPIYHLDLIAHRDVSNAVAERFGVEHQSPQLIIIQDGEVVFDASHSAIQPAMIRF